MICGSARKGSPHKRLAKNLMSWLTLTVLGAVASGLSTTTNGAVGRACGSPTFRAQAVAALLNLLLVLTEMDARRWFC